MGTPRATLYFLGMTGCPACEATKPFLDAFERRNGVVVKVVRVDLTETEWKARWEPKVTPTFIMVRSDGKKVVHEGALTTVQEWNDWVREALS